MLNSLFAGAANGIGEFEVNTGRSCFVLWTGVVAPKGLGARNKAGSAVVPSTWTFCSCEMLDKGLGKGFSSGLANDFGAGACGTPAKSLKEGGCTSSVDRTMGVSGTVDNSKFAIGLVA